MNEWRWEKNKNPLAYRAKRNNKLYWDFSFFFFFLRTPHFFNNIFIETNDEEIFHEWKLLITKPNRVNCPSEGHIAKSSLKNFQIFLKCVWRTNFPEVNLYSTTSNVPEEYSLELNEASLTVWMEASQLSMTARISGWKTLYSRTWGSVGGLAILEGRIRYVPY